ncbi:MAG: hypothetical protein GY719_16535 [bacterium]|nr:hypothetical protein [bacterium]
MVKTRSSLHVALALFLVSLTCDLGAACALAEMEGSCCCEQMGAESPCMELSGGDGPSGAPEQAAIESGQRFSVAVLDAPLPSPSPDAVSPRFGDSASLEPAAAGTPLYLSHCAFLC